MPPVSRCASIALGLILLQSTHAQTPDPQPRVDATELDTVQVTATRRAESTLDVPAGVTVVGEEQIREAFAPTAMDLLHGEVGTFVQQTTPGQSVVIVRGLKGSEVLHLVDGFRLNNAIFRNSPNQYIALVDGQSLGRIEVVRGPNSTLYGSDAMGGVVHMITPEPRFDGSDWQSEGRVRATFASADDSLLSRAEAQGGREGFALSGGVSYQDVDELRVGGGDSLPFTAFRARAGNLKAVWSIAEGHEIMLQAQALKQPSTPRFDELVPGFGQAQPNSSEFAFEPQAREFAQARWRFTTPTRLFDSLEVMAGHQSIRDDRRSRDFGSVDRDTEQNDVDTFGVGTVAEKTLSDTQHVSFGAEYYRDEVASARQRTRIDTQAVSERAPRFPDGSTMRQFGAFATYDWRPTDRLDLNAGLRYSDINTRLPAIASGDAVAAGVDLDAGDVSGNVGFNWRLSESASALDWRIVANAGRGFRAPNVFDLGVFGDRPGNRFSIPNADLEPENVLTFDAGIKFEGAVWSGEAIAFRSRYRDKITSVLTGDITDAGRLVVQNRNVTRQTLYGIETGLKGEVSDALDVYATATYTRGEETLEGTTDPADRVPPLYGKLGARWHPLARWRFEGYAFYATRQDRLSPRDAVDPRIDPDGTAGWVTWNARVAYAPSPDLELALRVENLGDHRYREHGSGLDEPGRNVILSADWRF